MNLIETMEQRRLMSVTVDDNATLRVSTAGDADVVSISLQSGTLHVSVNGQNTDVSAADVKRLSVSTSGGDDLIDLHGLKLKARINAGSGGDTVLGTNADDRILCGSGNDSVAGNKGNDSITGNAGKDSISAGDGNDTVTGDAANDSVLGGSGDDSVDGGDGDDSVRGGAGNDVVKGSAGNDWVWGEAGKDSPGGGDGEDHIYGGSGADEFGSLGIQSERKDYKTGDGDHVQVLSDPSVGGIMIRLTYQGDANLDGKVDINDLYNLANNFLSTTATWLNGDFNFDGVVNDTDLALLAKQWQNANR